MDARYGPASTEQTLGALPVVAAVCWRLDIAGIVDPAAPIREIAHATHGQVIVAMIANRLTCPTPMVHLGHWARQFAVQHAFAVAPEVLNDDRIARALDVLGPGPGAGDRVGRGDRDRLLRHRRVPAALGHDLDQPARRLQEHRRGLRPAPVSATPRTADPTSNRSQADVATAADGAVPVYWLPYDGGAAEVSQVVGTMQALRRLAGPRRFLLVGHSKLLSYNNIAAMTAATGVRFLAPSSKAFVPAQVLAGCDYDTATPVDFVAARDAHRSADEHGHYRVLEDTMTIIGPLKRDPVITMRRVFVHSSAHAQAAEHARAKKLDRARDDLGRPSRGLGSQHYPTPAKVAARITTIARHRHVGDYLLRTSVGTNEDGRPTLDWHFDQAAIDAEAATDGWYALLTNLPETVTAAQILARTEPTSGITPYCRAQWAPTTPRSTTKPQIRAHRDDQATALCPESWGQDAPLGSPLPGANRRPGAPRPSLILPVHQ